MNIHKNKLPIAINGQFTARRMTGQERFAYEIITELDKICKKGEFELIVPQDAKDIPKLANIPIIKYGKAKGSLWEQTFFAWYTILHKRISLNLCSIMPLLKPGIICIHDLSYKVNPQYFTTPYAKISQWWHKLQYYFAWKFSPIIFTVSEYSKQQMIEIYHVNPNKIVVIGNGWEHFNRIKEDETLKKRKPELFTKPYFFSLGSLAPNKNIQWILKVAQRHWQYNFFIAGKADLKAYGEDYKECDYPNVKFLGYISDGEIKYLMRHCKAFIFPSFFEGFGIPPLEALSVGAKVILAKSSCLPEIFGNSGYYINPNNTNVDLDEILSNQVESVDKVLNEYKFDRFAGMIHEHLKPFLFASNKQHRRATF